MDLLFFLVVFLAGFILFVATAYLLAKWLFPVLRDANEEYATKRRSRSRVQKKNPYSF